MTEYWKDFRVVAITEMDTPYERCDVYLTAADGESYSVQCLPEDLPDGGSVVSVPYYWTGGDILNFSSYKWINPTPMLAMPQSVMIEIWPDCPQIPHD